MQSIERTTDIPKCDQQDRYMRTYILYHVDLVRTSAANALGKNWRNDRLQETTTTTTTATKKCRQVELNR